MTMRELGEGFGGLVRSRRLAAGLSQEGLAELAGVSVRTVRNVESGRVGRMRASTVRLLADALGVPERERPGLLAMAADQEAGRYAAPAQLPPTAPDFTGRQGELARLTQWLTTPSPATPTVVVSGPAGVGKTALAVCAAHLLRDRFPDGQLYVDLGGAADEPDTPVEAGAALTGFLHALGVDPAAVPVRLADQSAMLRTLLADRRVLLVLDNARDERQCEPLLPGSPGCAVLVTSRTRLTAMAATGYLELSLLRGEVDRPRDPSPPPRAPDLPIPAQLPPDLQPFTGRAHELARLHEILTTASAGTAPVIVALSGTAGVGKTALAVHWAWQVRGNFPGGVLYVNLLGFDPGGSPTEPAAAVRRFLEALGVTPARIPADLDAQVALYRSLLAGRPTLVVLDNARDADQVRPLLPGCPGSLALVTSRNQLASLAAIDGAQPLTVSLMSQHEALQLLEARLGAERVSAEPDAAEQLITGCARLPLALAIVAARAANQPEIDLSVLAEQVVCEARRLDVLTAGDAVSEVRAVFSWSYRALSPAAAALYRLLGLHPGPDISAPAAASLAGLSALCVRPLLEELAGGNLLVEHQPGRYALHDLLRAYAAELACTTDTNGHRHDATRRMLDHYVHTGFAAARLLDPTRDPIHLDPPAPAVTPEHLLDHQRAVDWLAAELPVLLLVVGQAAATGWDTHTWQLTWALSSYLYRRGLWHEQIVVQRAAAAAAHRLAQPAVEARAHNNLADAYTQMGRYGQARTHLQDAIDLASQADDRLSQGHTHQRLAILCNRQDRHREALDHVREAITLFRTAGYLAGEAHGLNALGWCHARLGEHCQALSYSQQALTMYQDLDDRPGQADTWDSLGYAHHHLGHHTHAVTCYRHAIRLYRDSGDRYGEADTLTRLGDTHLATGNPDAANAAWQQALTILTDLEHPHVDEVQAKLRREPSVSGQPATPR